jgi:hypothetical protein
MFCKNQAAPTTLWENNDEWLQAPVLKRKRPIEQEAKIDCLTSRPFLLLASAWRDDPINLPFHRICSY